MAKGRIFKNATLKIVTQDFVDEQAQACSLGIYTLHYRASRNNSEVDDFVSV